MVDENVRVKSFCPECGEEFEGDVEHCPTDGSRLQEVSLPDDDEEDPLIGEELDDRFLLESVLGEGGMGRVYRGEQMSVERDVAVKVLRSELAREETIIKRFFREAKVISSLSHPNIVKLVDFGQDPNEGVLYLAMEFIEGHSLGDLLSRGRLKLELAVDVALQICGALSDPHERDIVHRDLKPENVMLVRLSDGSLQVKVVDFGIAHTLKQTQKLTQTGTVFGTPFYMAPEQAQGKEVGPHTDIYSLGVILYEMVSGTPPFKGDTSMRVMFQHIKEQPPPLEKFVDLELIPDELNRLIRSMLSKRPVERPKSAVAARERLQEIRRDSGFHSVTLDVGGEGDSFEPWIVDRDGPSPSQPDSASPPETDRGPSAPDTGDLGRASTQGEQTPATGESPSGGTHGRDDQQTPYRGERSDPVPTSSDVEPAAASGNGRSTLLWVAAGAGLMFLLAGLSVATYFVVQGGSVVPDGAGEAAAKGTSDTGTSESDESEGESKTAAGDSDNEVEDVGGETSARAGRGAETDTASGATGGPRGGRPAKGSTDDGEPSEAESERAAEPTGSPKGESESGTGGTGSDRSGRERDESREEEADDDGALGSETDSESSASETDEPSEGSGESEIATPDFADSESEESGGAKQGEAGDGDKEGGDDDSGGAFAPVE